MSLSGPPPKRSGPAQSMVLNRVTLFTVLGAILPGVGLIAAKRRIAGGIVLGVFLAGLVVLGVWALADGRGLLAFAVNPAILRPLVVVTILVGAAWVAVIVVSHLALRGKTVQVRPQRIIGSVVVAALAFLVAAPTAVAARYAYDSATLVSSVFKEKVESATGPTTKPTSKKDPWASIPRVNILLLGGDSDGGKRDGVRTDTVIVASVDTKTGDTVLISLPRNTARIPFPSDSPLSSYYPNGFTDGDGANAEYMLNALYRNVPNTVPKDVLGKTDNLGADALKIGVGEATGLKIDYYVLIDIVGFTQLINALGGITVNINTKVAIGGDTDAGIPPRDYLNPGPDQHLSGFEAMWFARGRYGAKNGDFDRMDRQRCAIDAIVKQANPANVVSRYEAIARASKSLIITDIPQGSLPAFVDLSLRVKGGNLRSIVFKNAVAGFTSANPNWSSVRSKIKASLGEVKAQPTSPRSSPSSSASSRKPSPANPTQASEDIGDACAYNPA